MRKSMSDWHGCYSDGWKNEITPDAFAHPAKFSRALIRRIYRHALERGYLKPGDVVLDPFAGVALGARDAIQLGINWLGVELEEKFVELGNQNLDLALPPTGAGRDERAAETGRCPPAAR